MRSVPAMVALCYLQLSPSGRAVAGQGANFATSFTIVHLRDRQAIALRGKLSRMTGPHRIELSTRCPKPIGSETERIRTPITAALRRHLDNTTSIGGSRFCFSDAYLFPRAVLP